MQADYVTVGAGSAGCVLANRLTEDPNTQVVLVEAGGRDRHPMIHIPAGDTKLLDHPHPDLGLQGGNGGGAERPEHRLSARPRAGRIQLINGMIHVPGQPEDFDHWAQSGNRGWSWDDVFPFFRKAENWEGAADPVHGKDGPLFTARRSDTPSSWLVMGGSGPLTTRVELDHTAEAGHPRLPFSAAARGLRAETTARRRTTRDVH